MHGPREEVVVRGGGGGGWGGQVARTHLENQKFYRE